MRKALNTLVVVAVLFLSGCSNQEPGELNEQEFLQRYGDKPLTPEGMAAIIDDHNKRAGRRDTTDYAQAYESTVTEEMTKLRVLEELDRGDTAMAKKLLIMTMNVNAGFLPVFEERTEISKEQREEAKKFATGYLDYLVAHTNEIQVGRIDFAGCFIGLARLLEDSPNELARLTNLVESVGWPEKHKGAVQPAGASNGSQPIRSETNRTSSAAGSRR